MQTCCFEERSAYPGLVKVGEEDAPWFCSGWPVYVAFEFAAIEPQQVPANPPLTSDLLKKVHLVSLGAGCL